MVKRNTYACAMLTDFYQLTMSYGYFESGFHDKKATFDLFFRENPFLGEYAIFVGLEAVLSFFENFKFHEEDIEFLQAKMKVKDKGFFNWLKGIDLSEIRLYGLDEGTVAFPKVPLLRVEGPLAVCQLLETPLLNLINYPSLVATNASRFRIAAGNDKKLLEFGLRRAQGTDGAVSASRYSYIGGFDSTSNVLAGMLYDIPLSGTHAHSFVQAYRNIDEIKQPCIKGIDGREYDLVNMVMSIRDELHYTGTNTGELTAFIAYALSYPESFMALVDTYDTIKSGIPNFICVALALYKIGYKPVGIRIDSGDLVHLSKTARKVFIDVSLFYDIDLSFLKIIASNNINEEVLLSLNSQGHEIDIFGIGTHLVTCQSQPALGGVYKLVEIDNIPRIKISQEIGKVTIPGKKDVFRLFNREGHAILDIMVPCGDRAPEDNAKLLCRHPFNEIKRVIVTPEKAVKLSKLQWNGHRTGQKKTPAEIRNFVMSQLKAIRKDHLRTLNPTPYKVSVSEKLYDFIHNIWLEEAPIAEIT